MVIFLYNLYIFVGIQHGILANIFFSLDPSNHVIKRFLRTCRLNIHGRDAFNSYEIMLLESCEIFQLQMVNSLHDFLCPKVSSYMLYVYTVSFIST